jgi:hypothetical protein
MAPFHNTISVAQQTRGVNSFFKFLQKYKTALNDGSSMVDVQSESRVIVKSASMTPKVGKFILEPSPVMLEKHTELARGPGHWPPR